MKNRLLALALLLGLAVTIFAQTASAPASRVQWEYKREFFSTRLGFRPPDKPEEVGRKLDALGAEGWELVHYYPEASSDFMGMYLFKRQKQ